MILVNAMLLFFLLVACVLYHQPIFVVTFFILTKKGNQDVK